jgi:anti-anti-sigma regulatory factor
MLRITVQELRTIRRLLIAGRLEGAWVALTESTWRSAALPDKHLEIDLSEVTWIDDAGWRLLEAMNQAGARLVAKGIAMEALVEGIAKRSNHRKQQT